MRNIITKLRSFLAPLAGRTTSPSTPDPDGTLRHNESLASTMFSDDDIALKSVIIQYGKAPSPFDDNRMTDPDGALKDLDPGATRHTENSTRLSIASSHASTARNLREAGDHHAAGAELSERFRLKQPEAAIIGHELTDVAILTGWLHGTRNHSRPRHSKAMSLAAKPAFLLGDVAVIFGMLYTTGVPQLAAVATGISAATGAVFAGTVAGNRAAASFQRNQRGPVPSECPRGLESLYRDDDAVPSAWVWIVAAAIYAFGLALGVSLIGLGLGQPPREAFGIGVLAMLTVAGSALAEAYSTNEAADLLETCVTRTSELTERLDAIGALNAAATRHLVKASTVRCSGAHEARAAQQTARVISDPSIRDPRTFGYVGSLSADEANGLFSDATPELVDLPALPETSDDAVVDVFDALTNQLRDLGNVETPHDERRQDSERPDDPDEPWDDFPEDTAA